MIRTPRGARPGRAGLVLAILALAAGCGGEQRPGADGHPRIPRGTPVILVSVDTLRSDRLPMYGYREVETPALDALRDDSILFARAFSPVPMTLPAHASLLTGLYPADHGVRDNMGYQVETEALPWLPRILEGAGYRTGAAVSAFVLRGESGMAEGFELYEDRMEQTRWTQLGSLQRPGSETLARALDWLGSVHEEPFFLLFHIYEPHRPIEPPEPFRSRYGRTYDAEVAAADQVVGELLDELRRLGVYDRAVILFLSDHGEGLGDHGLQEHGPLLYREQLQVPLLLKLPGGERAGATVTAAADLVDVVPTLLGLLGLEAPEGLAGRSLLGPAAGAAAEGARTVFAETLFPRLHFGWSELGSAIEWPYHYIHGPDPELYDLERDPGETRNVLRENRRAYARLRDAFAGYDLSYRAPGDVDADTRSKLAALGYLGTVGGEADGPLPDPKTRLHVLEALGRGLEQFKANRFREAAVALREVLAEEPRLVEAWQYLGHSLMRLGRHEEAVEAYRELMELTQGAPYAALAAAGGLLDAGRVEEAAAHARLATEHHPAEAHDILAIIALGRGDAEAAERHAETAVEHRGPRVGPLITRAQVALERDDPEGALGYTDRVLESTGETIDREFVRGLFLVRGRALAALGRAGEAERALLREIELFPGDLPAYSHLSLLYALTGDGGSAGKALQRMVETNPTPAAYAEAVRTLRVLGDPGAARRLLQEARRRWPESALLREAAG